MRKLGNVEKNVKTSLEVITSTCSCRVICTSKNPYEGTGDPQREYAYTGTMPQGENSDF